MNKTLNLLNPKTDGTNIKMVKKKKTELTTINTGVLDTSNAVEDLIENQQKRIQCEHCDKTFSNQYIAKYHNEKVHLKIKSKNVLSCSACEKKFVGPPSRLARYLQLWSF